MRDEPTPAARVAALLCLGILTVLGACTTPAPTPMAEPAPAPAAPRGPESSDTPAAQAAPTPGPTQAPRPTQAAAPPQQAPASGPAVAGPGGPGTAPASRPCFDVRPAMVRCPAGEELTHAGCEGPDYIMHCAPKRKP